jgi:hypothetical protein
MWLPRFIDKCRVHFTGALPPDYQIAICRPHGIDGIFLAHFGVTSAEPFGQGLFHQESM